MVPSQPGPTTDSATIAIPVIRRFRSMDSVPRAADAARRLPALSACHADGPRPPTGPGRMIARSYPICQAAQEPARAADDLPLHPPRRPPEAAPGTEKKAATLRGNTGGRPHDPARPGLRSSGARELAAHSIEGQTQLEQGLALELPNTLLAELEDPRHRLERELAAVAHPETALEDVALPRRKLPQGP